MLENSDDFLQCLESLIIETYIIGYYPQGESIVNIVKCDGVPVFSFVVDSYRDSNSFLTKEILDNEKIKVLNMICWTHPHNDHSLGLSTILDEYSDENTEVWIPEKSIDLYSEVSKESKELFAKLVNENRKRTAKYRVFIASDNKNMLYQQRLKYIVNNNHKYLLEMNSFAPSSSSLFYKENSIDKVNINEESIVFCFSLGGVKFVFTGDSENADLMEIPKKEIEGKVFFNKIPHHGSATSDYLIKSLIEHGFVACSTIYRKGSIDLPNKEVIGLYKNKFDDVYCTCDGKVGEYNYGYIKLSTDIINKTYGVNMIGLAMSC